MANCSDDISREKKATGCLACPAWAAVAIWKAIFVAVRSSHSRARGKDEQIGRVQSAEQVVQVDQPGCEPREATVPS